MPNRGAIGVSRADADGAFDDEVIDNHFEPLETGLEEELEQGGDEAMKALRAKQRELIDALPLNRYEIEEGAPAWAE
jgi:N-acetyltransferase 10